MKNKTFKNDFIFPGVTKRYLTSTSIEEQRRNISRFAEIVSTIDIKKIRDQIDLKAIIADVYFEIFFKEDIKIYEQKEGK